MNLVTILKNRIPPKNTYKYKFSQKINGEWKKIDPYKAWFQKKDGLWHEMSQQEIENYYEYMVRGDWE